MISRFFLYASVYKAAHHRKMNHLHLVHMHDDPQIYCLERQIAEEGLEIRPAFKERYSSQHWSLPYILI